MSSSPLHYSVLSDTKEHNAIFRYFLQRLSDMGDCINRPEDLLSDACIHLNKEAVELLTASPYNIKINLNMIRRERQRLCMDQFEESEEQKTFAEYLLRKNCEQQAITEEPCNFYEEKPEECHNWATSICSYLFGHQ